MSYVDLPYSTIEIRFTHSGRFQTITYRPVVRWYKPWTWFTRPITEAWEG
jgi:hypothetical protein